MSAELAHGSAPVGDLEALVVEIETAARNSERRSGYEGLLIKRAPEFATLKAEAPYRFEALASRITKACGGRTWQAIEQRMRRPNGEDPTAGTEILPLEVAPVSTWAAKTPPPRAWTWEGWIPAGRVTSLMGDGGVGKSIVSQTIATACASSRGELYGVPITAGVALGLFAEEEQEELERRQRPICEMLGVQLASLDDLHLLSLFGEDNIIARYEQGIVWPTALYQRIEATCARLRPHLLVIDPGADFYGGNPISQSEVRQFVQVILGGLCKRYGCTVLLPMHPSAAGLSSGEGDGFSVAWHNSVRSRLYLKHASTDPDGRIVLMRKKANYAPRGEQINLIYDRGAFVQEGTGGIVDAIQHANSRRAILALLAECESIGRRVASSSRANENAATILGERAGFPAEFQGKGRSNLFRLFRELHEAKLIDEATVSNASRHPMGIWQLTDAGRAELRA